MGCRGWGRYWPGTFGSSSQLSRHHFPLRAFYTLAKEHFRNKTVSLVVCKECDHEFPGVKLDPL